MISTHLAEVFTSLTSTKNYHLNDISRFLESPFQMELLIQNFIIIEIKSLIKNDKDLKKAAGFGKIFE